MSFGHHVSRFSPNFSQEKETAISEAIEDTRDNWAIDEQKELQDRRKPAHLLDEPDEQVQFSPMATGLSTSSDLDEFGFGDNFFTFDEGINQDAPILGDLSMELARSAGGSWLASVDQVPMNGIPSHHHMYVTSSL